MKAFLKDFFSYSWRWNRLKFWIYPLVLILPFFLIVLPILWTISFISLQWYSDDAKNSLVYTNVRTLTTAVEIQTTRWNSLNSLMLKNNKINFEELRQNSEDYKNPFWWDYLIFVKDDMFQIYSETDTSVVIKWNYYQKNKIDPLSLVLINWEYKQDWDNNWKIIKNSSSSSNNYIIILSVFIGILYIIIIYIIIVTYIKRLHDLDKSGWWILLLFVPFANFYLWIICGFFKWTIWENRFWPDPLGWIKSDTVISKEL